VSLPRSQSESRMREIRTSGLMSGEGKRVAKAIPRPSSTLPSQRSQRWNPTLATARTVPSI